MIETERLCLREWREEHAAPHAAMCADAEVMRHLGGVQARATCGAALERRRAQMRELGHCFWAVERRTDRAFVGLCGLQPGPARTPVEGGIEIGWRLVRSAWGRGYAREAAAASVRWGWANLAADGIAAITVPANARSRGLMERLGMTRRPAEDFDHPALALDDPLRPHIVYRIGQPI